MVPVIVSKSFFLLIKKQKLKKNFLKKEKKKKRHFRHQVICIQFGTICRQQKKKKIQ